MANEDDLYDKLMQNHIQKNAFSNLPQAGEEQSAVPMAQQSQDRIPDKVENSFLYKALNPINNALTQTGPGAALTGIGEGVWENAASIPNMFLSDENKIGSIGSEKYLHPEMGGYAMGGKLAGNLLADVLGARAVGVPLRGMTGMKGLLSRVGATAGLGYATGEHFPEEFGGRLGSAGIGALFPVAPLPGAGASSGEIGKNVLKAAENATSKYGADISNAVAKSGPIPKISVQAGNGMLDILSGEIKLGAKHNSKNLLHELIQSPTPQKAQDVLSALKKEQRGMLTATHDRPSVLPDASRRAYDALTETIQTIEKNLEKGMGPEVFNEYKNALTEYAANAAPYAQDAIEIARHGHGPASNIPKGIFGMEAYSRTLPKEEAEVLKNQFQYLMQQHPELWINKFSKPAAVGGGGLYVADAIHDYFKSLFNSNNHHTGNE